MCKKVNLSFKLLIKIQLPDFFFFLPDFLLCTVGQVLGGRTSVLSKNLSSVYFLLGLGSFALRLYLLNLAYTAYLNSKFILKHIWWNYELIAEITITGFYTAGSLIHYDAKWS